MEMPSLPMGSRRNEDIALDLMKFVAMTTGYGKTTGVGVGFQKLLHLGAKLRISGAGIVEKRPAVVGRSPFQSSRKDGFFVHGKVPSRCWLFTQR